MIFKPRKLIPIVFLFTIATLAVVVFLASPLPVGKAQDIQTINNGKISFSESSLRVMTIEANGTGQQTLIGDGFNQSPAWKPDGTKIAFARRAPMEAFFSTYVMNPDGTGVQKIGTNSTTNDFRPVWSPDGTKIAFVDTAGASNEIAVMNADGTNRVNLTNNSAREDLPAWSPDGTRIAFISNRDFPGFVGDQNSIFEIYVMNADGSNQTRLTNNMAGDFNPSWSPDGLKIVFDTTRDGNGEVYSMNANGTNPINLTNNSAFDFNPIFSPDGNRIAFLSFRDVPPMTNGLQDIYTMNPDGSNVARITNTSIGESELSWQKLVGAPTPAPTPTPTPTPSPSPLVVISQVYGNGGTPGATFNTSFVELFNRGTTVANLNQWSIRFMNETGSVVTSVSFASSGSIPLLPGQYMLIGVGAPTANGQPVNADFPIPSATLSMGTSGQVMLVKANANVPTGTPCALPNSGIADFVGYGNATGCFEGSGPVPTLNNTTAALRKSEGCLDNENNTGDFTLGAPNPRRLNSATHPCNLIDDVDFFVRQHYIDFLNRQADASGLGFWKNEILQCGNDATCAEVKRINVSAAFYLSIEFQQTGYLVYRTYKAAYGLIPNTPVPIRLNEFLPDTQQIGQNVVVGSPGWEAQLESNKVAYFQDFVTRQRFTTAYSTSMTPTAFVDALFLNTGVTPSSSDRTDAINEFGGAGDTANTAARGRALRRVAENSLFATAETNRAFVLMEYFGYLRRNPNDPPEANLDFAGYNFWLNKLNQFNGNFIQAEMVKAFLSSIEYRQRFGP